MEGDGRMKYLTCERRLRGRPITATAIVTGAGVQIGLYGGDQSHIGAVGVVDPAGEITIKQFETHKEGILCRRWCDALARAGIRPVVLSAGVHYDNACKEEITQILQVCEELLAELLGKL